MRRNGRRRGLYRTVYGTYAYVYGPKARCGDDVVRDHKVPIGYVSHHRVKKSRSREQAIEDSRLLLQERTRVKIPA